MWVFVEESGLQWFIEVQYISCKTTFYVTQTVPAIAWLYSAQGSLSLATLSHMLPLFH